MFGLRRRVGDLDAARHNVSTALRQNEGALVLEVTRISVMLMVIWAT